MLQLFTCAVSILSFCLSIWVLAAVEQSHRSIRLPLIERRLLTSSCLAQIRDVISRDRDDVHGVMELTSRPS